jgi:branched-subunit amino acid aminotransferase/4-amino-4-deoxychorismate lyase
MPERSPTTAWHNGKLVSSEDLLVSVDDVGFRQGVIAVERMRTYDGRVAAIESHVVRWRRTLEELYLTVPVDLEEIRHRVSQLLMENRDFLQRNGDCGIVMLATPGVLTTPTSGRDCNEMLHLLPLDHNRLERHRTAGQPVFVTDVEQPAGKCWPRDIKVRCRLHYYLADQQARHHHVAAVGLLIDQDGTVTETSVANIAIVRAGRVISPPADQVLPGITQELVKQACEINGIRWEYDRLWPSEIREAEEVWLMGTDGGLWFASRVDGSPIGNQLPGKIYTETLEAFDRLVRSS